MRKNDFAEIKKLGNITLLERVKKLNNEIIGLILDKNMGKLTDLKIITKKRRDIAQIKTVLSQKMILEKLEESNEKNK